MKNLKELGETLSKKQQKEINGGGFIGSNCVYSGDGDCRRQCSNATGLPQTSLDCVPCSGGPGIYECRIVGF